MVVRLSNGIQRRLARGRPWFHRRLRAPVTRACHAGTSPFWSLIIRKVWIDGSEPVAKDTPGGSPGSVRSPGRRSPGAVRHQNPSNLADHGGIVLAHVARGHEKLG